MRTSSLGCQLQNKAARHGPDCCLRRAGVVERDMCREQPAEVGANGSDQVLARIVNATPHAGDDATRAKVGERPGKGSRRGVGTGMVGQR